MMHYIALCRYLSFGILYYNKTMMNETEELKSNTDKPVCGCPKFQHLEHTINDVINVNIRSLFTSHHQHGEKDCTFSHICLLCSGKPPKTA